MNIADLERVANEDDTPEALKEIARAAHCEDWHQAGEKLGAADMEAQYDFEGMGFRTTKSSMRSSIVTRMEGMRRRLLAAGIDADDVETFGQGYAYAGVRKMDDLDERTQAHLAANPRLTSAERRAKRRAELKAAGKWQEPAEPF